MKVLSEPLARDLISGEVYRVLEVFVPEDVGDVATALVESPSGHLELRTLESLRTDGFDRERERVA